MKWTLLTVVAPLLLLCLWALFLRCYCGPVGNPQESDIARPNVLSSADEALETMNQADSSEEEENEQSPERMPNASQVLPDTGRPGFFSFQFLNSLRAQRYQRVEGSEVSDNNTQGPPAESESDSVELGRPS